MSVDEKPRTAAEIALDDAQRDGENDGAETPEMDRAALADTVHRGRGKSPLAALAASARASEDPDVELVEDDLLDARLAAADNTATEEDWDAVTEWLLGDTTEVITRKMMVRVGGSDSDPLKLPWIVRAIPIDVIRAAEREASGGGGNRQERRNGVKKYDELKANLRVIVEGTVKPDLKAVAAQHGLADAAILVSRRLAFRPGVIARLAGEIMALSGFDDDDVTAVGN